MEQDDHTRGVGRIITNLEALEFVVRIFLTKANDQKLEFPTPETTELPVTFVTNYMPLGELIGEYNKTLNPTEQIHRVDDQVIKIRDAFAHGRIYSNSESFPIELYKFSKPKDGKAAVEYAETLTTEWLKEKGDLIHTQTGKVVACGKSRKYKSFG
jgi:hypothetical protein